MILHKYSKQLLRASNIALNCRNPSTTISRSFISWKSLVSKDSKQTANVPTNEPLPKPNFTEACAQRQGTKLTVLQNGLRVVTQPKFGMTCNVGVLVNSGSRYEINHKSGINHFLDKINFMSTSKYKSAETVHQRLQENLSVCHHLVGRDVMEYNISTTKDNVPSVMELLSEVVLRPRILNEEVEQARQSVQYELDYINIDPNPDLILNELIHSAAYQNNTLGLPLICPQENVPLIDRVDILNYLNQYHTPDRMALIGVGVDHQEFVNLAKKHFTVEPSWSTEPCVTSRPSDRDLSVAQYTGGMKQMVKDLSNASLGPSPIPDLAHIAIGLPNPSDNHEDFVPSYVLTSLLGGLTAFSAGGPGKGIYSRLYLNVVNRYPWIDSAIAYNNTTSDSGLFFIQASSSPNNLKELTRIVIDEFIRTLNNIYAAELGRAKARLQSSYLMGLESGPATLQEIGKQILSRGKILPPEHVCELIEKVTQEDIHRVVENMILKKPFVAAYGNLNDMPNYDYIANRLKTFGDKKKIQLFGF